MGKILKNGEDFSNSDLILIETYKSDTISLASDTYSTYSFSFTIPDGYTAYLVDAHIAAPSSGTGYAYANLVIPKISENTFSCGVRNLRTSASSDTSFCIEYVIMYLKTI